MTDNINTAPLTIKTDENNKSVPLGIKSVAQGIEHFTNWDNLSNSKPIDTKKIKGFKPWNNKSKILGVDNKLHKDLIEHNESIKVIKGLYMYHWYRGGTTNKTHLL